MRHLEAQLEEKNQELQRVCALQTASVHFSFASIVLHLYSSISNYLIVNVLFVTVMATPSTSLHHLSTLIYVQLQS